MLHVLKFAYEYPAGAEIQTKFVIYEELTEAQRVFDHLELGYQFNQAIRLKGSKMVKVTGVWLYETFKSNYRDAIDDIKSGGGTLMDEAREIEVDIDN